MNLDGQPFIDMTVGSVLVFDRALTPTERAEVDTYLAEKYLAAEGPAVAITSPENGASVKGWVTITADAPSDADRVELAVDGVPIGTDTDGSDGWGTRWYSAAVGDGQSHELSATSSIGAIVLSNAVADFDGDGATDIGVFRPSNGRWYIQGQPIIGHGANGDIPLSRPSGPMP